MYKLIRPLLFKFDAETTHNQMLALGVFLSSIGAQHLIKSFFNFEHPTLESEVFGIKFKNSLGTSAGFDKAGKLLNLLPALGFSHMQVGDVSALPHSGNPRPRLFRLPKDKAIINRLGQNNKGADFIAALLKDRKFGSPVFVSLVKTPDPRIVGEKAVEDFVTCFRKLSPHADISVINISCPNTAEGKTFEEPESLNVLLDEIIRAKMALNLQKPILVKISPDLSLEKLDKILEICEGKKIDGYILTNTSTARENLNTNASVVAQIGRGGLSGQPIRENLRI